MERRFATNINTGQLISKSTALYRKLKKLGQVTEIEPLTVTAPPPSPSPEPEPTQAPLREKVIDHRGSTSPKTTSRLGT